MVVDDFHVVRAGASLQPFETDPPLVVDPDAPLSFAAPLQGFQPVAGGATGREGRSPRQVGPACARQCARSRRKPRPARRGRTSPFSCRRSQLSMRFHFGCYNRFERRRRIRVTSSIMPAGLPNMVRMRTGPGSAFLQHAPASAIRIAGPLAVASRSTDLAPRTRTTPADAPSATQARTLSNALDIRIWTAHICTVHIYSLKEC